MLRTVVADDPAVRYIFFSGKGGVGKTTVAASTAVWLADQGFRTLIVSTDVQPSLSDLFHQDIPAEETPVQGVPNLTAYSVEPKRSYARHRQKLQDTLRVLDPDSVILKQMAIDAEVDCGSAQAAVFELSHYLNEQGYDKIVFDTAPTGMLLEKITAQVKYALSMAAHIEERRKGGANAEREIDALEELRRQDDRAVAAMRSPATAFFMTLTPEAMPLAEVERAVPMLEEDYGITVRGLVINRIVPPEERDDGGFWQQRWGMQKKYIRMTEEKFSGKLIGHGQLVPEVTGLDLLREIGARLYTADVAAQESDHVAAR